MADPIGANPGPRKSILGSIMHDEIEAEKYRGNGQLTGMMVDEFEAHLAQANRFTRMGRSTDASVSLGKAQDWLKEVKDKRVRTEMKIRIDQARALIRV